MSIGIQYKVDSRKIVARLRAMKVAASNTQRGPVRDGYNNAAARYENFLYRRFVRFSNHGGYWQELSPVTIAKRRAAGFRGSRILYVTGKLLNAMRIGSALTIQHLASGFRIGFSQTRLGKIARYQHGGTRTIPSRLIIVRGDERTLRGMRKELSDGYRTALREARESVR